MKPNVNSVPPSFVGGTFREPGDILAEIRQIYFRTRRETIRQDLADAIVLLKTLPTEDDREKARVYMDGLSQMRSEWAGRQRQAVTGKGPKAKRRRRN